MSHSQGGGGSSGANKSTTDAAKKLEADLKEFSSALGEFMSKSASELMSAAEPSVKSAQQEIMKAVSSDDPKSRRKMITDKEGVMRYWDGSSWQIAETQPEEQASQYPSVPGTALPDGGSSDYPAVPSSSGQPPSEGGAVMSSAPVTEYPAVPGTANTVDSPTTANQGAASATVAEDDPFPTEDQALVALAEAGLTAADMTEVLRIRCNMPASEFLEKYLSPEWEAEMVKTQGFESYAAQEWIGKERYVTYKTDTPIGMTRVTTTQKKLPSAEGRTILFEQAVSHDVPYADSFKTVTVKSITPTSSTECLFKASVGVKFTKSTIMKSAIQSNTIQETTKRYKVLLETIEELLANSTEGGQGSVTSEVPLLSSTDKVNMSRDVVPGEEGATEDMSIAEDDMDAKCMKFAGDPPGFWEKGNISNVITSLTMIVGLVLKVVYYVEWNDEAAGPTAGRYILAMGLFGFAGGVTNWVAVKMLFDDMCGLPGSGIIPKQFRQIRDAIKRIIMETFFDQVFLEQQLSGKVQEFLMDPTKVEEVLNQVLDSPQFSKVLDQKLEEQANKPGAASMMLNLLGLNASKVKPFLKLFMNAIGKDVGPKLGAMLQESGGEPVLKLRIEIEKLVDQRLNDLTALRVKKLIEAVMKKNLGWLVVWGNIFGGLIGVISEAVGY